MFILFRHCKSRHCSRLSRLFVHCLRHCKPKHKGTVLSRGVQAAVVFDTGEAFSLASSVALSVPIWQGVLKGKEPELRVRKLDFFGRVY